MNAAISAQNCPKLPKTAKTAICPKLPKDKTLKFHQKSRFYFFSKIKISMYRAGTRACFHRLDFQSKNFSYAICIVKNRPLYVNFSIPPCGNWWFSQGSTPLVGMRFCGHVPNSPRNKNLNLKHTHLGGTSKFTQKSGFFGPQKTAVPLLQGQKKLFLQLWMLWSHKW